MISKDGFKLFVLSVCCITSFALAESDIKKLYTLRDSFAGTKDLLQSWFDPETPPCHWSGITCKGRTVVAINLSSVPLRVPFPSYIVAFQSLVGLYFRGCGITGVIPEALGKLQHLHYLDLSNNQLTGSIPVSLYKLKMLKEIVLDKKQFVWAVECCHFSTSSSHKAINIHELHLWRTSFDVGKPAEFGEFSFRAQPFHW
ncbi:hypothetical protein PR202_ga06777 [Eleusine coracana subsp. coracana]|uniref:Leucine-rich repeat-containing N-terminal plant-type domain-containing protein n=1 Tax=Eleusine coracana subsp. coracana TaxID=191504 RepID=A0AAV5BY85_ELECO|nr:hypothetical protein PR202_ga06777 [Eleusine coracana subsp. coracana]